MVGLASLGPPYIGHGPAFLGKVPFGRGLEIGMLSSCLLAVVCVPLFGAILVAAWPGDPVRTPRLLALVSACLSLAAALIIAGGFDRTLAGAQMVTDWDWLPSLGIKFQVGLDGISLWLVVLTALLSVTAVLVSWEAVRERTRAYYALLLVLESG